MRNSHKLEKLKPKSSENCIGITDMEAAGGTHRAMPVKVKSKKPDEVANVYQPTIRRIPKR